MSQLSFGDTARNKLRALVETIERELTLQPTTGEGAPAADSLRASWHQLVEVLALGPAPETRQCPVCSGIGMRAATRCSSCWAKLAPLDAIAPTVTPVAVAPVAVTPVAATAAAAQVSP